MHADAEPRAEVLVHLYSLLGVNMRASAMCMRKRRTQEKKKNKKKKKKKKKPTTKPNPKPTNFNVQISTQNILHKLAWAIGANRQKARVKRPQPLAHMLKRAAIASVCNRK